MKHKENEDTRVRIHGLVLGQKLQKPTIVREIDIQCKDVQKVYVCPITLLNSNEL